LTCSWRLRCGFCLSTLGALIHTRFCCVAYGSSAIAKRPHDASVSVSSLLQLPTVLRGHSRDLRRTDEKRLGSFTPNVVPANTRVLVAHLVTFSESQWYQFHVQLVGFGYGVSRSIFLKTAWHSSKALTNDSHYILYDDAVMTSLTHLCLALEQFTKQHPDPRPLRCSAPGPHWGLRCTLLAMYFLSHTFCRTPPEQTAKMITLSLHLLQIIIFVTNVIMRLIYTFVPNWRCFDISSEDCVHIFRLFLFLKLMTVGSW